LLGAKYGLYVVTMEECFKNAKHVLIFAVEDIVLILDECLDAAQDSKITMSLQFFMK
jgi:hypothetical protein